MLHCHSLSVPPSERGVGRGQVVLRYSVSQTLDRAPVPPDSTLHSLGAICFSSANFLFFLTAMGISQGQGHAPWPTTLSSGQPVLVPLLGTMATVSQTHLINPCSAPCQSCPAEYGRPGSSWGRGAKWGPAPIFERCCLCRYPRPVWTLELHHQ